MSNTHRPETMQSPQRDVISPAVPHYTVHTVLWHTALRHRSLQCVRSPVIHFPSESKDFATLEPLIREWSGPVTSRKSVFDDGQNGYPLIAVAVDSVELPR